VAQSYRESESFRMMLPIRAPRSSSNYREGLKRKENVLITMLREHERQRRSESAVTTRSTSSA
jgi:hypothetical protein